MRKTKKNDKLTKDLYLIKSFKIRVIKRRKKKTIFEKKNYIAFKKRRDRMFVYRFVHYFIFF